MSTQSHDAQAPSGCPVEGETVSLADVEFTDPALMAKPNAFYRALREQDQVHYDAKLAMYLVSRHADLDKVFRDPVTFSQELGYYSQMAHGYLDDLKAILRRDGGGFFPDVVNVDPPRHARARQLTQQAFTAHRIASLEPEFSALVDGLIDRFIDDGAVDALSALALPMAIQFAMDQLKVRDLPHDAIRRWGAAYLAQFSLLESREQMEAAARDLCELQNYLIALVHKRIAEPQDDMLSDLIAARIEDDEPQLRFDELVATARAILINTHDSVSTALTNILFKVATDPQIAAEFYASAYDDKRMSKFVEELMRLEPPVRAMSRMTTRQVELGGKQLPEGAHLLLLFASGNDDEGVFEAPRCFNMERPNLTRSMSFGAGAHLCLGISLARMQLRVAARQVARRLENISLAVPEQDLRYIPNVALLSMESLPLTFSRRS